MRYRALATDYDGTIAHHGVVNEQTIAALIKLRDAGRTLIMVTGRELEDLQATFPHCHLFERIVVENGALVYTPATQTVRTLTEPPPEAFLARLRSRGVPFSAGRSIVATVEPHQHEVLQAIQELGLEWHVIFNKGCVMVLPSGVNKATGLIPVLKELNLAPEQVVGVGDAENDHAFLSICGCGAAVSNALPAIKERADLVLSRDHGEGVQELIARMLADDLAGIGRGVNLPALIKPQTA